MFKDKLGAMLTASSLFLSGCGGDKLTKYIDFRKYDSEKPLVVGVNGLTTHTLEYFVSGLSSLYGFPYIISDVSYWEEALDEIQDAHKQRRKIFLIGASAGCRDVLLIARKCEKDGIEIERMILINPFYTTFESPNIPQNVKTLNSYFSTKFDLMWWANGDSEKFKRASNGKTEFTKPEFIDATHSDYTANEILKGDLKKFFHLEN